MENRINIAELLKDCPQGMDLDCTMFENPVKYMGLTNSGTYIKIKTSYDKVFYLTKEGYMFNMADSKCVIFPKGKATWEGFQRPFKPGDIVITNNNEHAFIYSGENDKFWECYCGVYCGTRNICINSKQWSDKQHELRLATKKEIEKLFQVIKDNGYNWNAETKTLEKVEPKFKVWDSYALCDGHILFFKEQDNSELVPNKFDINTLKPFDKVLVRLTTNCIWMPKFFSYYDTNPKIKHYPFVTTDNIGYPQCIPYNGNEHLCRKADKCDEFYKNW